MNIHLVAICGVGMGSLAGLLKEAGHEVRGSDRAFYPPMSERLAAWGIPTLEGFDPAHIAPDTELVVVGNACRPDNLEVRAAFERGLPVQSFPQTLAEMFIRGKRSVMVAGTHGKTTTTSLIAHLLVAVGRDPGFLIGGVPLSFGKGYRLGQGDEFVVEGDEYDSAFFDKRPKFVHYRPDIVVLTSVEFDHADIYADMDAYRGAFRTLVDMLPPSGLLVAYHQDDEVRGLIERAACPVRTYGFCAGADWRAAGVTTAGALTRFRLARPSAPETTVAIPLAGRHNVANAVAALAVADALEVAVHDAVGCLSGFGGVARRMQLRGQAAGVSVLDDFAHHPTEVAETVRAARSRYPDAELIAVFEPRTNTSRRRFFQQRYAESFAGADQVVLVPPFGPSAIPEGERFDSAALVDALRAKGQAATWMADADEVVAALTPRLPAGAVVLVMSNGAFGDIHRKLLDALRSKAQERA